MQARRRTLSALGLLVITSIGGLPDTLSGDDAISWTTAQVAEAHPALSKELLAPFDLQFSVQPGNTLLAPRSHDDQLINSVAGEPILQATFWEPSDDTAPSTPSPPTKLGTRNDDTAESAIDSDAVVGLFDESAGDRTIDWSSTLDSQAENRVDSAIRATGVAVIVLGLLLVGFLSWHRMKETKLTTVAEAAELSERGRLPITQTCRLHLVRAGNCDVLVAVDRGSVRAMTPLPADFSTLTSMPFDEPADLPVH